MKHRSSQFNNSTHLHPPLASNIQTPSNLQNQFPAFQNVNQLNQPNIQANVASNLQSQLHLQRGLTGGTSLNHFPPTTLKMSFFLRSGLLLKILIHSVSPSPQPSSQIQSSANQNLPSPSPSQPLPKTPTFHQTLKETKEGSLPLYMVFRLENISAQVDIGAMAAKVSYSNMLIKSLKHEMLTPIHIISCASSKLSAQIDKADLPPETKQAMQKNVYCGKQLSKGFNIFVDNILDFSAIYDGTFELRKSRFTVEELFSYLSSIFYVKIESKQIMLYANHEEGLELHSDRDRIIGVLFNFLDNSVKFTTKKGKIILKAYKNGANIVFKVIDTGRSIPKYDLEKLGKIILDPYFLESMKDSAGLGVGMRMSHALLKKLTHGDLILQISSEKGYGTTIQFEILQDIDSPMTCSFASDKSPQSVRFDHVIVDSNPSKKEDFRTDRKNVEEEKELTHYNMKEEKVENVADLIQMPEESLNMFKSENEDPQSHLPRSHTSGLSKHISLKNCKSIVEDEEEDFNSFISKSHGMNLAQMAEDLLDHSEEAENGASKVGAGKPRRKLAIDDNDERLGEFVSKRKKVALVVDDEIMNTEMAAYFLEGMGLEVETAEDGDIALNICTHYLEMRKKIDVVFMDYNMPGLNGDEVTAIMKEKIFDPILSDCFFIGITAQADPETIKLCKKAGMDIVEQKPFTVPNIQKLLIEYNILTKEEIENTQAQG